MKREIYPSLLRFFSKFIVAKVIIGRNNKTKVAGEMLLIPLRLVLSNKPIEIIAAITLTTFLFVRNIYNSKQNIPKSEVVKNGRAH
jgi:hypothetical protein